MVKQGKMNLITVFLNVNKICLERRKRDTQQREWKWDKEIREVKKVIEMEDRQRRFNIIIIKVPEKGK